MGGLGSAMNLRSLHVAFTVTCGILLCSGTAAAGGMTFGVPIYALDLSGAFVRVPIALNAAYAEIEEALIDSGVPQGDIDEMRERVDEALDQINDFAATAPPVVPVPLLGGTIEISLPLVVLDGVRFTGGLLNERVARGVARLTGVKIPEPLFDEAFDAGEFAGAATIDVAFSTWMLSTDVVKRFDALVLALTLGGGVDLIGGRIEPLIDLDVPAEFESTVDDVLTALHLDELSWSTFAVHGVVGLEIGPPFLRVYGDIRFVLPLSARESWWDLRSGALAAVVGLVIRF